MTGKELTAWRTARKLKQVDLASLSGVDKSVICRFEKHESISHKNYEKLMTATNWEKAVVSEDIPLMQKVKLYIKEIQFLIETEES